MGAAFGGGAAQQVFGGRGAGNLLTRATAVCAGIFMLTSVSLAYVSSSGDRDLKARIVEEQRKGKGNEGTARQATKPKPATPPTDGAAAGVAGGQVSRPGPARTPDGARRERLVDCARLLVALKLGDRRLGPSRGLLARLGRRLRAHGHRAAVRARAAARSERHELAALPLLARGRGDDGRSGARSASARAVALVLGALGVAAPYAAMRARARARAGRGRGDGDRDGPALERVARRRHGARRMDRRAGRGRRHRDAAIDVRARPVGGGLALLLASLSRYEAWPVCGVFAVLCAARAVARDGREARPSDRRGRPARDRMRDRGCSPGPRSGWRGTRMPTAARCTSSHGSPRSGAPSARPTRRWPTSCSGSRARWSSRRPRPRRSASAGSSLYS